jgi:hypothetical protein
MARRQRARRRCAIRVRRTAFRRNAHGCGAGTPDPSTALISCLRWEGPTMRWKDSHRSHDPRHIDLMAALALVIVIVAVCRFLGGGSVAPTTAAFIVPSQSVRW